MPTFSVFFPLPAAFFCAVLLAGEMKSTGSLQGEKNNSTKPHFIYMEKLRDYLSSADIALRHSLGGTSDNGRRLVATSIETKRTKGIGKKKPFLSII